MTLLVLALGCGNDQDLQKQYPAASATPEVLDFGEVAVEYSAYGTVEVINSGRATLELGTPELTGDAAVFSLGELPETLNPDERATLDVGFLPPQLATYTATLVIPTNDPDHPNLPVTLTGVGVEVPTPDIEVDPLSLDFGMVVPGEAATSWVTVSNAGDGPLTISSLAQAGSGAFAVVGDLEGFTLAPDQSTNLVVLYAPTTDAGDNGSLTLYSDDPRDPEVVVTLLGNGGGDFQYPVAVIDGPATAVPRETLELDGSGSYDPNNYVPLTYTWTLLETPEGSGATFIESGTDHAWLTTDLAGTYRVQLQVENTVGLRSAPAIYEVEAIPTDELHVELTWNTSAADLDLHLLTSDGELFVKPYDCNYCNQNPDWGTSAETDDPTLAIDDLYGWGPENIIIPAPADDYYYVKVHYFSDNGDDDVVATVKVYTYGELRGEFSRVLGRDDVWDVAEIRWPEGGVLEEETDLYSPDIRECE